MGVDLKKEIKEIADIAKACPEEFRLKCFEILLNHVLGGTGEGGSSEGGKERDMGERGGLSGIRAFKEFCKKYAISEAAVSNVFDFGNENFIQISDFKQNTKSKQQIVIALLDGVNALHQSGVPTFTNQALRNLCENHKVYDSANFAKHMASYKKYFISADKDNWKLTTVGLQKAAEVINSLGESGSEFKL